MTRGTMVLITGTIQNGIKIYSSIEFNGDMYPTNGGYGKEVIYKLLDINEFDGFKNFVTKFNETHFRYDDENLVYDEIEMLTVDISEENYFHDWGSDYLYVKNASGIDFSIIGHDGQPLVIPNNAVYVFRFGTLVDKVRNISDIRNKDIETFVNMMESFYNDENKTSYEEWAAQAARNIYDGVLREYFREYVKSKKGDKKDA